MYWPRLVRHPAASPVVEVTGGRCGGRCVTPAERPMRPVKAAGCAQGGAAVSFLLGRLGPHPRRLVGQSPRPFLDLACRCQLGLCQRWEKPSG